MESMTQEFGFKINYANKIQIQITQINSLELLSTL